MMTRPLLRLLMLSSLSFGLPALGSEPVRIDIWHGDRQRVGHQGTPQDDFNIVGHVSRWQKVDLLEWFHSGRRTGSPLSFRAYRRLVEDGDFNVDVPIKVLKPGENTIRIRASLRDGTEVDREVTIVREDGSATLPFSVDWSTTSDPQDYGQIVDGHWRVEAGALRTSQIGYDRVFLMGDRDWRDYEILSTMTVHNVAEKTNSYSGGNGVGIIWRFAGHVVGGHRHFPAAQPKWGYQPFGAIGWLRWTKGANQPPQLQFYPGDSDRSTNYAQADLFSLGQTYSLRHRCETLDDSDEHPENVTRYSFKIWPAGTPEPDEWNWQHIQSSRDALRTGGFAFVAHHVDVSFGNLVATAVPN